MKNLSCLGVEVVVVVVVEMVGLSACASHGTLKCFSYGKRVTWELQFKQESRLYFGFRHFVHKSSRNNLNNKPRSTYGI